MPFLIVPIGDVNPTRRVPIANYLLLAANLIVFLLIYHRPQYEEIVQTCGTIPAVFHASPLAAVMTDGWKIIASQFLHGGYVHLFGNMLFLWIVGDNVEDRLGHLKYLGFYLLSGTVAGIGHIVVARGVSAEVPCIGASGAIAGVIGAYLVWFPRRRIRFWYFFLFLIGTFSVPAVVPIGLWFIEQLLLAKMNLLGEAGGVAYWAHIGGFIFGLLVAAAYRLAKPLSRVRFG